MVIIGVQESLFHYPSKVAGHDFQAFKQSDTFLRTAWVYRVAGREYIEIRRLPSSSPRDVTCACHGIISSQFLRIKKSPTILQQQVKSLLFGRSVALSFEPHLIPDYLSRPIEFQTCRRDRNCCHLRYNAALQHHPKTGNCRVHSSHTSKGLGCCKGMHAASHFLLLLRQKYV